MSAEQPTKLAVVPPPPPDEWDDVLDTADILAVENDGVPLIPISLPDLFDGVEEWDQNPTRELPLGARGAFESGFFRRAEPSDSVLDAAVLVTDLQRRHAALHSRLRRLEALRFELAGDPSWRAAWGTLAPRFADVAKLAAAAGSLARVAAERGGLDAFVPSRPLAAWARGVLDYAELLTASLAALGQKLAGGAPDWDRFVRRVAEARGWIVPELLDEVRADLALLALQIGEKPIARLSAEVRRTALAQDDVEAALADWLG